MGPRKKRVSRGGDELMDFISKAVVEVAEEVVGKIKHHKPKRWWTHEVDKAYKERASVYRKLRKLEQGSAPHALLFKVSKAKTRSFRMEINKAKKLAMTELMAQGTIGIERAMNKVSGVKGRDGAKYMGTSATLKWRHFNESYSGEAQVAKGVSDFTEEVSAG